MNLFFLNTIHRAAQDYSDKHVNKILLEATQMLYTVLQILDPELYARLEADAEATGQPRPYRKTHANHPMTRFAGSSPEAYDLVVVLATKLNAEYVERFKKDRDHACMQHIARLSAHRPRRWEWPAPDRTKRRRVDAEPTVFGAYHCDGTDLKVPLCMPREFHHPDAITAYRRYYQSKDAINVWRHSPKPEWYNTE